MFNVWGLREGTDILTDQGFNIFLWPSPKEKQVSAVLQERDRILEEKNHEIAAVSSDLSGQIASLTGKLSKAKTEILKASEKLERMQKEEEKLSEFHLNFGNLSLIRITISF